MERLSWKMTEPPEGTSLTTVVLTGTISEDANLERLAADLNERHQVRFELAEVKRINSAGVREWVNFIRKLSLQAEVELAECSPPLVDQLNVFANFAGSARVVSVLAPFLCVDCDEEESVVVEIGGTSTIPPPAPRCKKCGQEMEFDNLVDAYFRFVELLDAESGH